jgi:hypothetical protein
VGQLGGMDGEDNRVAGEVSTGFGREVVAYEENGINDGRTSEHESGRLGVDQQTRTGASSTREIDRRERGSSSLLETDEEGENSRGEGEDMQQAEGAGREGTVPERAGGESPDVLSHDGASDHISESSVSLESGRRRVVVSQAIFSNESIDLYSSDSDENDCEGCTAAIRESREIERNREYVLARWMSVNRNKPYVHYYRRCTSCAKTHWTL